MIKFAKAIGANTDLKTAQAFIYQSSLAVIISGSGDDVFIKIRQEGTNLEEIFFTPDEPPTLKIPQLAQTLVQKLETVPDLEILIAFWQGEILYLYSTGNHKAYLKRDDGISNLIPDGGGRQLISGFLKPGDKLLLINSSESADDIYKRFIDAQAEFLEEEMELYLRSAESPEPTAAILIDNQPEEDNVKHITFKPEPKQVLNLRGLAEKLAYLKSILPKSKAESFESNIQNSQIFDNPVFKNKKLKLTLAAVFVLLILVWAGTGFLTKKSQQKNVQIVSLLQVAHDKYSQAQNLKDLDPAGAKGNLEDAKKALEGVLKLNPKSKEALNFKKEVEEGSNRILKVVNVSDWPLFLSLDLIKKDFSANRMSFSLGKVLLLDEGQKTLVVLDLAKKSNQILAGHEQLGNTSFIALNGASAFAFSEDKGVLKIDIEGSKAIQVIKPDDGWGKIADIFGFGGNIYLLDSGKNQIWKYVAISAGYSDKNQYLKLAVDLSGAKKLKIDYSVWVQKNNEVLKFTAGKSDFFSIGGLEKPLNQIDSFFVPEDVDKLYILDKFNARVVILKKNGQYISQITGDKFKTADDFVVDESGPANASADGSPVETQGKLYLLEGNKIYQIEIK